MKKQYLVAIGLFVFLVIWMLIPREHGPAPDPYAAELMDSTVMAVPANAGPDAATGNFIVRVARSNAATYTESVAVRGVTQAFRLVNVRAEASGRVIATPVARGARVNRGDVLCELAVDNREIDLQEARSRQEQARLEYEGSQSLRARDLVSEIQVAQLKAAYDSAIAAVGRAELALERTKVRAPFSGIMESRNVEVGDYMDMGGQCASLLDDQPMLLVAQVPEQDVAKIELGSPVVGKLVTGEEITGRLTYIARAADPVSRSYRIEAQLDPADEPIRQGISTDIRIAATDIKAHLIPPSAITLDDRGTVGVKTVNSSNVVEFYPVTVVGESTALSSPGFWVTGLPDSVVLITLGQELVFNGQTVNTASGADL